MDSIPAEIINIVEVKEELEGKKRQIDGLTEQNKNIAKTIEDNKTFINKANEYLNSIDIDDVKAKTKRSRRLDWLYHRSIY